MRAALLLLGLSIGHTAMAGATEWQDFLIENGLIVIAVEIEGQPGRAVLGSGNNANAINMDFVNRYPEPFQFGDDVAYGSPYHSVTMITRSIRKVRTDVLGVPMTLHGVVPLELDRELDLDLLLGWAMFDWAIVQIDYPGRRLRIVERKSLDLKALQNIPAKKDPGGLSLLAQVRFPGEKPLWLGLSNMVEQGLFVERKTAERRGWLDKYDVELLATDEGAVEQFVLPELTIGPYTLENIVVAVEASPQADNIGASEDGRNTYARWTPPGSLRLPTASRGMIGRDVLKHFLVTADYDKGRLHLQVPEVTAAAD